jgi:hypothetical protein
MARNSAAICSGEKNRLARVVLRQLSAGGAMIHRDGDEAAIADEVDENFQPGRHGTPH